MREGTSSQDATLIDGIEKNEALDGFHWRDLAIVTRGAKQPFQIAGGLDRLLDAYRAHSRLEVSANQVHLHELCLIAGWHRAALMGKGRPVLDRVRSLLRRLR